MVGLWLAQVGFSADKSPPFLYAAEGAGKILKYDSAGQVAWEYPAEMARDVWALPNGHILFCFNQHYDSVRNDNPSGVMEVTPDKQVVFSFATTGQVWSCQRLTNGATLVGASSQGRLLVVNPEKQIIKTILLRSPPGHSCLRNARQLLNGNFLVAEESAHVAREYQPDGNLLREIKVSFAPYSAVRRANGNTVICGERSIIEVDPSDKMIWSARGEEFPGLGIRWFAGIQLLPNGNIFVCNAGGKVVFFEISPSKQITWNSGSTTDFPLGHGIQRLDTEPPRLK